MATIEADYLVIGAGATAMAFVDTLVEETAASVVVVDRNHALAGTGPPPTPSFGCTNRRPTTA